MSREMGGIIGILQRKGRVNPRERWWVSETLANDCERAWLDATWYEYVNEWQKRPEDRKKVREDISSGGRESRFSTQGHQADIAERDNEDVFDDTDLLKRVKDRCKRGVCLGRGAESGRLAVEECEIAGSG